MILRVALSLHGRVRASDGSPNTGMFWLYSRFMTREKAIALLSTSGLCHNGLAPRGSFLHRYIDIDLFLYHRPIRNLIQSHINRLIS